MDIVAFVAGLIVGIVIVSIAVEFAWKKSIPEKTCKLIRKWRLDEIKNPLIVAERLHLSPPSDARVVVATPSPLAKNARENPDVVGNFAVGLNKAFIFAGEIKEGQLALVTSDEDILKELRETFYEFYRVKEKVVSYVPKKGRVKIRGVVRAVFPYRDGYLMRVSYEGGLVGVLLKERMDVEGRRVEIEGDVVEYPFINPINITVLD
ncbi:MAG: hypothetical protein DRN29_08070 [Thermoplasmata archaeon]|nr:MAG: hypothetical protein DRN29_08070 [Thermoplasmata archaeon]